MLPSPPATGVQHPYTHRAHPLLQGGMPSCICHPRIPPKGAPNLTCSATSSPTAGVTQLPLPHEGVPSCTMKAYQNRSHRHATSPGLFLSNHHCRARASTPPILTFESFGLCLGANCLSFPLTVSATEPRHSLRLDKCSTIDL